MLLTDFYIQKKIRDGDIGEFERLFGKYYGSLCHHANKILHDMDTAEDIVQEFFYNFWKKRESFSPKFSLNAYLYQSIRNNALLHLKHLAVREIYAEHVYGETENAVSAENQEGIEIRELRKVVNATLQQMPQRCAKVFSLNRFEGKKYREIAEILSISIKTVEADMGKALQLFRKSLKEFTGEEVNINS